MKPTLSKGIIFLMGFMGAFFYMENAKALTYIPAPIITLTGTNNEVFFDVEDDIVNAGTSIPGPRFSSLTKKFSGTFYLSGAGWVNLAQMGYSVGLDCGAQALDALTAPCLMTGTGYSEIIGDVVFDGKVKYYPGAGLLYGTASTFIGEYTLSAIAFPLLPAKFKEGTGGITDNTAALSISGSILFGNGPWTVGFTPVSTLERRDISPDPSFTADLSLAADYDVEITDPQGSITRFQYIVQPDIPSFTLYSGTNFRKDFCNSYPTHSYCQDGATQKSSELSGMGGSKVANASDTYTLSFIFRDTYGNEIKEGDISFEYQDKIRTFQVNPLEYMNFDDYCVRNIDNYCSLITTGPLITTDDGSPDALHVPVLGGITFSIASRAPTNATDSISLSGIVYRDKKNVEHNILQPPLTAPLTFTPWYQSSLTSDSIIVGESTAFTSALINTTPAVTPDTISAIYHIDIGTNALASYSHYEGEGIVCSKHIGVAGSDICNWVYIPDTSIVALWGSSFSGIYTPYAGKPDPENVSYRSFVRYTQGGTTVIYPSIGASLGMASAGKIYLKILGQDTTPYAGIGVDNSLATTQWNSLKKNIGLKSRGRSNSVAYTDVDYIVHGGNIAVNDADIHGPIPKRAIVTIGGDITLNSDIARSENAVVIIALMDSDGNGGNIIIDPSVREISASLFAEKAIRSSGDNQLYILGNVFSHNTLSDFKCPFYVTGICNPEEYNLEKIRQNYLALASKVGHTSGAARASEYLDIPLIIEYDGRLLTNPPSLLEK